jgi:hypothetical protein
VEYIALGLHKLYDMLTSVCVNVQFGAPARQNKGVGPGRCTRTEARMATFKYEAVVKSDAGEDNFERGYVVASSRAAAEQKIKSHQLEPRRLYQITGIRGLFKAFSADIK